MDIVSCQTSLWTGLTITLAWEYPGCRPPMTFSAHVKNSTWAKCEEGFGPAKAVRLRR
jgi:hypothetical protein